MTSADVAAENIETPLEETLEPSSEPTAAPNQEPSGTGRRLRADAQRNYDGLIVSARTALRDSEGDTSLEDIARRAGVGIGTLYRHFPTRLALLEAVYRDEVDELDRKSRLLVESDDPKNVLRAWLVLFLDYAATKRALFHELAEAIGKDSDLLTHSRAVIERCAQTVLDTAQAGGGVRADVEVNDIVRLVGGCTMMPGSTPEQRERMLRVVVDGLHV